MGNSNQAPIRLSSLALKLFHTRRCVSSSDSVSGSHFRDGWNFLVLVSDHREPHDGREAADRGRRRHRRHGPLLANRHLRLRREDHQVAIFYTQFIVLFVFWMVRVSAFLYLSHLFACYVFVFVIYQFGCSELNLIWNFTFGLEHVSLCNWFLGLGTWNHKVIVQFWNWRPGIEEPDK